MPIPKRIEEYLKKTNKKFEVLGHKTVYTAYDLAQTLKKDLKEIGKALMIKVDDGYKIVVVPASQRLNIAKLKRMLKAKKISIPNEKVMARVFKVKPGALSAFGVFHKVETLVDKSLLKAKEVVLQAGSFTESVVMKAKDFVEVEGARLGDFTEKAKYNLSKAASKVKKAVRRKKK